MIKEVRKLIKKLPIKVLSLLVVSAMLVNYFMPVLNVFATSSTTKLTVTFRSGSESLGKVQYSLNDGSTWTDITSNTNNQSITVTGNNLKLKIVPGDKKQVDYAGIELRFDDVSQNNVSSLGLESAGGFSVPSNIGEVKLENVEFKEKEESSPGTGGGDTATYQGNGTATLNYSISGVIEYTEGGGYDHGIGFYINGIRYKADESKVTYTEDTAYERDEHGEIILGNNNQPIPILDPNTSQPMTEKTGLTITGDTINYDYDTNTNKVSFVFTMAPGTLMTGLVINNKQITNLPKTSSELQNVYNDHKLEIEVNNIDVAETYDIQITARYPNSSEEFMGNFLWDYNPQGYTGPDDKILHGTLELVQAKYNNHVYKTADEINALGGVYIWRDAPRKDNYTDDREGCGEAQFPKGTILTVKIVPDAGYQLIDFGINGGVFEPQEEIGIYSFEVQGGPFHLQATIEEVDDEVRLESQDILFGFIDVDKAANSGFDIGTAKLEVSDNTNMSAARTKNFEDAAYEEGYTIDSLLDISLYNAVYKGGLKDSNGNYESWDTPVDNLSEKASISLALKDDLNGKDIVVVHEKHDGNNVTYELIDVSYMLTSNSISFETDSFSSYAIATKDGNTTKYTLDDADGNTVSFVKEPGHTYSLEITNYAGLTDEQLEAASIPKEYYNEMFEGITNATKDVGTLVGFYQIEVTDENSNLVHNGPFKIKIKMTDDMKKYNTFKIMFVDTDNNFVTESPILLTKEGDYLVGTIDHLSTYAVLGSNTGNPQTGDLIYIWIGSFAVAFIVLVLLIISMNKKAKK